VSQSASRGNFPEEEEDFAAPKQALSSFDNFLIIISEEPYLGDYPC
jgi:hypothetical protein